VLYVIVVAAVAHTVPLSCVNVRMLTDVLSVVVFCFNCFNSSRCVFFIRAAHVQQLWSFDVRPISPSDSIQRERCTSDFVDFESILFCNRHRASTHNEKCVEERFDVLMRPGFEST
jgi:hypothetical protein